MNDSYDHKQHHVFYITENIIGPVEQSVEFEQLVNNFNSELGGPCSCEESCTLPSCMCLQKSGGENYQAYYQNGQLKHKIISRTESLPIFECSERCSCCRDCGNRIVSLGPIDGLEIKCSEKGLGLYTTRFIPKGMFICEYAGELITKTQASVRHQINQLHSKMNYIFCLKEHFGGNVVKTFVDPSVFGNIGRYMNHSCEPNCYILPVRCENSVPKLAIFTAFDIRSGDELCFHYGSSDSNNPLHAESRIKCLCKAENCMGFIPFHNY